MSLGNGLVVGINIYYRMSQPNPPGEYSTLGRVSIAPRIRPPAGTSCHLLTAPTIAPGVRATIVILLTALGPRVPAHLGRWEGRTTSHHPRGAVEVGAYGLELAELAA